MKYVERQLRILIWLQLANLSDEAIALIRSITQ